MTNTHRWTEKETEYVINNYPRLSTGQIAIRLGIEVKRVKNKIYCLKEQGKLSGNYHQWKRVNI